MIRELTERLVALATKDHYPGTDDYPPCPARRFDSYPPNHEYGPCDCGAEDHNKLVAQVAAELFKNMPVDGDVIYESQDTPPIGGSADPRVWKMPEFKP